MADRDQHHPAGHRPAPLVDIVEVEPAPGAAELLYRALLTSMPVQRADLDTVTPHGDTAEHLTYRGHHLPETT